jgi:hypothetical protein
MTSHTSSEMNNLHWAGNELTGTYISPKDTVIISPRVVMQKTSFNIRVKINSQNSDCFMESAMMMHATHVKFIHLTPPTKFFSKTTARIKTETEKPSTNSGLQLLKKVSRVEKRLLSLLKLTGNNDSIRSNQSLTD